MTTKEKFLKVLKDKANVYLDVYNAMKDFPEDMFDSLNGHDPLAMAEIKDKNKSTVTLGDSYGKNVNALRDIITSSGSTGVTKQTMIDKFPDVDGDKKAIVTNSLSLLRNNKEVEGYKPKGVKMKGFYWRMLE